MENKSPYVYLILNKYYFKSAMNYQRLSVIPNLELILIKQKYVQIKYVLSSNIVLCMNMGPGLICLFKYSIV